MWAFSSPEAALLLVSTKNHDLWPGPIAEVRNSWTSRHSAHAQSQVWQIWLVLVSIYCVYKSIQTEMLLDLARGCGSWCWPKGVWPLGTRIKCEKFNTEIGFFKNTFGEEAFWCVHCIRNLAHTVYFGQQNTPSWLLLHTIWWIRKSWQWIDGLCSWWVSLSPKANFLVKNFMNLIKLLLQSKLS